MSDEDAKVSWRIESDKHEVEFEARIWGVDARGVSAFYMSADSYNGGQFKTKKAARRWVNRNLPAAIKATRAAEADRVENDSDDLPSEGEIRL